MRETIYANAAMIISVCLIFVAVVFLYIMVVGTAKKLADENRSLMLSLDDDVPEEEVNDDWAGRLKTPWAKAKIRESSDCLTMYCAGLAKQAGWDSKPREVGTELMLMVSEIAEAMEGDRKGLMDDHLPHRPMLEVELADLAIRLFHFAGKHQLDVSGAIVEKLLYNTQRADHKLENRAGVNGKKY